VNPPDEDVLCDAIVEILRRSHGMPVGHLQRHLSDRGRSITVPRLTRLLLADPMRFRATDRERLTWALQPDRVEADVRPRTFRDRTPTPREWQSTALSQWAASGHRGIVQAITGAGKTLVGIIAVRDAAAAGMRSLVLVPTTPLIGQWEQSLLDNLPGIRVAVEGGGAGRSHARDVSDVIVSTVQTASGSIPDGDAAKRMLLVADEAHHYAATTFRPVVRAPFGRRLGLTATLQRSDGGDLSFLTPTLGGIVFKLDYARALAEHVVAPFDVTLVAVDMDAPERSDYAALAAELDRLIEELRPIIGRPPGATGADLHGGIVSLSGRGGKGVELARAYVRTLEAMNDLLDSSPAKMDALADLAPEIHRSAGTIVFTQTVELARAAARRLNAQGLTTATLTSQNSHEERRATLARFAAGDVKVLIAPQLLDEGIDVPDADLGIVLSASRTRRQMVQRMGRIIRPKPDGRRARFAIIFGDDTREDPAHGAHSAFLEEVLPLAGEVVRP
jgi:RNA polymerase primary sigma factor